MCVCCLVIFSTVFDVYYSFNVIKVVQNLRVSAAVYSFSSVYQL